MNQEPRICMACGKLGYFHCWAVRNGETFGVVEFDQSTRLVDPEDIIFSDEKHAMLCAMNQKMEAYKNDRNSKH